MKRRVGVSRVVALMIGIIGLLSSPVVFATTSTSPSYQLSEPEFGAGSALETCSGQYCAQATIGSLTGEDATSPSYTASFGPLSTDSEPSLDIIVNPGDSNLGILSTDSTAWITASVQVRSHLAGGYYLQVYGSAPTYADHTLRTPSSPIASTPGEEQFAINAVANTTPNIGLDPVYTSSTPLEGGTVLTENYRTADTFMYQSGDTLAEVTGESSQIQFTISMIVNVSGSTPAGHYSGDFSAVVTPRF